MSLARKAGRGALLGLMLSSAALLPRCFSNLKAAPRDQDAGTSDAKVHDVAANDVISNACENAGGRCVTAAPSGWTGPFAIYDGNPENAPSCPSPALDASAGIQVPAGQACSCGCDSPSGLGCAGVPVTVYQMSNPGACGGCSSSYNLANGACVQALACGSNLGSIVMDAAPTTGGSCAPSQTKPALSGVTWGRKGVGCPLQALASSTCWQNAACLPKPAAPYAAALCVSKTGDVACPGTPYSEKRVFYAGFDDTRDCAACSCGAPQGGSCTGSIGIYDGASCGAAGATYNVPQSCTWKSSYAYLKVNVSPSGGSCSASGGEPTGTATPKDPVTVCCEAP